MHVTSPAPYVPGDAERMSNALTKVLGLSKAALLKEEAKWTRTREPEETCQEVVVKLNPNPPFDSHFRQCEPRFVAALPRLI